MINNMDKWTQRMVFKSTKNLCEICPPHTSFRDGRSHWKHLTKTRKPHKSCTQLCQWSASIYRPQTRLAKTTPPNLPTGVSAPIDGHCTIGGPLLSGVEDYGCFSYKTRSRPVISGNIKDLFACREMTETFISVNQQIVPFSNGLLGEHREEQALWTLCPHCPGTARRPIWFPYLVITEVVSRDLPLSENGPQQLFVTC